MPCSSRIGRDREELTRRVHRIFQLSLPGRRFRGFQGRGGSRPYLPDENLQRPGERDGQQSRHEAAEQPADQAAQRCPDQDRDQHEQRADLHRLGHDHRVQDVVLDLLVGEEDDRGDDARSQGMREGEQRGGDAGQRPADHGEEVHQGDPQPPQQRVRDAEDHQRHEHDNAGDERGHQVAEHVAGHGLVHLGRHRGRFGRPGRPHLAQDPGPHLRRLDQEQQDQEEDRQQLDDQGEGARANAQGRLAQRLGVGHQLGRVALHPVLDVVPGHQVADPAPAVLRVGDVAGQRVGQVGDPVHQRVAERQGQADEDQRGQEGDDRDGSAPARDQALLHQHHDRVEQQRDEPGHHDQQEDVLDPVDQLPGQVGGGYHADRDQDGQQAGHGAVRPPGASARTGPWAAILPSRDQHARSRREGQVAGRRAFAGGLPPQKDPVTSR